ncbi:unnamed protein product [Ambrosiozyma monospora]|uniref:Unnamed protein product n=1 Tax=Ambrosiozyma monospora TaxID=43982 RepID=A0ACB5U158_AMBMO|nr:unnamed protein product [Ambrosiozyma monospora]
MASSSSTAAPQVYGADEVNAVVLDPGSFSTSVGYAGYDCPSMVLPSHYGEVVDDKGEKKRVFNDSFLYTPRENMKIKPILKNNIITDWDGAVDQYKYMFKEMAVNPEDQPLMLTESTMNSYKNKEKALEVFLEQENYCAFYAVKQPTCVAFAHGKATCLVVDIGHDLITVTPVVDGFCLRNQVIGTNYAGAFLDQQLKQFLEDKSIDIVPQYKVKSKNTVYWENKETKPQFETKNYDYKIENSVDEFSKLRVFQEMKETVLSCNLDDNAERALDAGKDKMDVDNDEQRYFELPNGLNVPFTDAEANKIANSLFKPSDVLGNGIVKGWEEPHVGNIIETIGTANDKSRQRFQWRRKGIKLCRR